MKWAALVTWFITIDGGLLLAAAWVRSGGFRRRGRQWPRIGPELVLVHFSLAATAFGLWIVYLVRDELVYAVIALCALAAVAVIGFTMFGIWLVHRLSTPRSGASPTRVDQRLPVSVIVLHGLFAAVTLALVAAVVAPKL
jgi:hypothetical protein